MSKFWIKSKESIADKEKWYYDACTLDTHQAYTEILTLREIIEKNLTDWSNLGMILSVVR